MQREADNCLRDPSGHPAAYLEARNLKSACLFGSAPGVFCLFSLCLFVVVVVLLLLHFLLSLSLCLCLSLSCNYACHKALPKAKIAAGSRLKEQNKKSTTAFVIKYLNGGVGM